MEAQLRLARLVKRPEIVDDVHVRFSLSKNESVNIGEGERRPWYYKPLQADLWSSKSETKTNDLRQRVCVSLCNLKCVTIQTNLKIFLSLVIADNHFLFTSRFSTYQYSSTWGYSVCEFANAFCVLFFYLAHISSSIEFV